MIFGKQKKEWKIAANYSYYTVVTVVSAATLPKAFKEVSRQWHMDDLQEISITEVLDDERSEGISGADQVARRAD